MAKFDTDSWQLTGWQGITLRTPEDWHIGAIGGDRQQGYLRLDCARMPRVETKWQHSPGLVNVSEVVDKYLAELQRKPKKGQAPVQTERDIDLVSKRQMRVRQLVCFRWRGEVTGHGAGWYCERCERMMLVQVMALPEEDGQSLAREIIGNLQDHSRGGWTVWAAYGLHTELPDRFEMSDQKLMAGLIEFRLKSEGEELIVGRWGMANVALKGRELEGWARTEVAGRHKGVKLSYQPAEVRGHQALRVAGEQTTPLTRAQVFVMHCLRKPFPETVRGLLWHCADDNKLFYVGGLFDNRNAELVDEVVARTPCHREDGRQGD